MTLPLTLVSDEVRAAVAGDSTIGAGNFLARALAISPAPDEPILILEKPMLTFSGESYAQLSLNDIDRLAKIYAGLYKQLGVRAQDPVFVYLDDGAEYLIHYLALVRLGAIGVLTNGNMAPKIALAHARNVGAIGIFTDAAHLNTFADCNSQFKFIVTDASLKNVEPRDLPIMIAHSSGTTGIPKAVLLQQEGFFFGVRYRLSVARVPGGESILSSLPHSHNCAIAYITLALLSGTPVYITSDHNGESVLRRISEVKPRMVVSFPQTYVEMTECELDAFDLSSVNLWFNGGDAAHETHIRALVKRGSHTENGQAVPGSIFIDGMGSSEMGFSLFRNVHTANTNNYNRCVGRPLEWVEAQILSEDGEKLGPNQIGRLGVKAPSVTTGYWNNSVLTFKSRLAGYFLTGDLAYRDEEGRFFHVDRTPDVIRTRAGLVYGLKTEEFLMSRLADIADCTVFGQSIEGEDVQIPTIRVRIRPASALAGISEADLLATFNRALAAGDLPLLGALKVTAANEIPLGTTGKVLKSALRETPTQERTAFT
jgi:acyl-coenzyme A synthetase/AMP-(fatty) acid ligase